nr:putative ribonuclease H-like domain-containing protein [Tanacetum cinerariifolium]
MFAVCSCARHQVTPKDCHLHAVKRIFRYLKGHPKLGLWYPKESPFDLVAYSDSDYGGASQERKSTTRGRTSKYWDVLRMLMINLRLIPLGEFNTDFHPMVDFIAASPLRRNLKLRDEDGIVSISDTELFENLTLMGPKSTGFNEFSSNIATALICLATNRTYNFSKMIFDGMVKNVNNKISKFLMNPRFLTICLRMSQFGQITHSHKYVVPFHTKKLFTTLRVTSPSFSSRIVPLFNTMLVHQGEGSGTLTEPHHTPSLEANTSHPTTSSIPLPSLPTAPILPVTQTVTTPIRQYSRRERIAQSSSLPTVADEPASPIRDVSKGEACPTESGFLADQDRATIAKSSTLPHDSAPRVTSPTVDEGREVAAERISNDSEEIARVLTSMDAATVLAGGIDVPLAVVPFPLL